ncbi:GDSL lipase/esterase [Crassisporium funariophilum]|nr:GDSL lipase/esterase [Crassisporium funariophilum]
MLSTIFKRNQQFIGTLSLLLFSLISPSSSATPPKFKNFITFGDSYTDATQSSNGGTAWPIYAASYSNTTLLPFAKSGATCSNNITARPSPSVFESQVPLFLQEVGNGTLGGLGRGGVEEEETLYFLWIGTNDVGDNGLLTGHGQVVADGGRRASLVDVAGCMVNWVQVMYENGARNFMFQNMIPLERTPLYAPNSYPNHYWTAQRNTTEWSLLMSELVLSGNAMTKLMLQALAPTLAGAHIGIFDAHSLFTDMLARPAVYLNGTAPLNTTGAVRSCVYSVGEPTTDTGVCTIATGSAKDSFIWFDELHPSEQAGRIVAREVAQVIGGEPNQWMSWLS